MIYHLFIICLRAINSDDCKNIICLSRRKVLVLLHFLGFQKSSSQRHWDQILCQRHNFIAPVYCWILCNNRMDLIILWAVALEITELERKFIPVLWTTQDPADLKRSQKLIEPFQWAIGEQGKPCVTEASCHFRSLQLLKCNSISCPPFWFFPLSSPHVFLIFLALSHILALEMEGGIIHLFSGNLYVLGRLKGKNCYFWRCQKSDILEFFQVSVLKNPIEP